MYCPWSATTVRISPRPPESSTCRTTSICGRKRVHIASMRKTPRCRAATISRAASSALRVNAFSTRTCLPASMAFSAWVRCSECGEAT